MASLYKLNNNINTKPSIQSNLSAGPYAAPDHNSSQDVSQTWGGEGGATSKCKAANIISYLKYYHENK